MNKNKFVDEILSFLKKMKYAIFEFSKSDCIYLNFYLNSLALKFLVLLDEYLFLKQAFILS